MQIAIVFLVAMVTLVASDSTIIPLISRNEVRDDNGEFSLRYETGNGIVVEEKGVLQDTPDGKDKVLVKTGGYSYTSPEGSKVSLSYSADQTGFHPTGDHLPKPVQPVPPTF